MAIMHMVHLVLRELKWNGYKPSSMTRVYYLFTTFDGILIRLNANLCKVSSKKKMSILLVDTGYIDIYQLMKR
ncbi:hypothetical protein BN1095_330168 [Clostridioides difficile]|uniref:Uncharacterized protein n=1 Tax=Clostridioides difficile TaxID=1496 RepID=A0A069ACE1_CLODI|nr:hypothetical protein BN169_750147 [Clostridioides difficile E16]CCL88006.1 hypothetical protein BN189_2790003 [Clostridioides difficile T10]CCL96500.1 hypothetical protein BN191_610148 [Clostridioides difficile T61]CDS85836.1 hypothetical protein BN1096_520507 [Clostridioides difficile]CDT14564.1 hypothetical protein BN1095_330168 [Clostridioides difficile]